MKLSSFADSVIKFSNSSQLWSHFRIRSLPSRMFGTSLKCICTFITGNDLVSCKCHGRSVEQSLVFEMKIVTYETNCHSQKIYKYNCTKSSGSSNVL